MSLDVATIVRNAIGGVPLSLRAAVSFKEPVHGAVVSMGTAFQDKPDRRQYAALTLVESRSLTLFYIPNEGQPLPALRSTVVFGGEMFSVVAADPVAPDGSAFAASLVVTR
jgi:hypothetical protein